MSKTLKLFNKIISESEEQNKDKLQDQKPEDQKKDNKAVDGADGKPNVIQENEDLFDNNEDQKDSQTQAEVSTEVTEAVDPTEEEFVKNLLRASELQAINIAIKSFIDDVKSKLGTNSAFCVNIAQSRLSEIESEFKEVVEKIKSSREEILKEAEKAKNKENLISIFDKAASKAEESEKDVKKIIIDSKKENNKK